jgi:AcrR family transcriptional regulator
MTRPIKLTSRSSRRLQTRERILGAATAEFKRAGMAGAEVGSIVSAAGVAHGTFYFHFATKQHVLLELEGREEARIASDLGHFLGSPHELGAALTEVVRLVMALEHRFGRVLFKEILGLHFSPSRPGADEWTDHPVIVLLIREIEQARGQGDVHPEVDAFYSATFFLLGIYGVLCAAGDLPSRDTALAKLVASAVRGLEA